MESDSSDAITWFVSKIEGHGNSNSYLNEMISLTSHLMVEPQHVLWLANDVVDGLARDGAKHLNLLIFHSMISL